MYKEFCLQIRWKLSNVDLLSIIVFVLFDIEQSWLYSQTCSNDHLYKTTTRLRRPMLSSPKQIPIQLLLYKTTTCLTRPATSFLVSQMKKNLSKTTAIKFDPAKKWETNIRQQCIKNKRLSHYIYSMLLYNAKFV